VRSYSERRVFTPPEISAWRRAQQLVGLVSDDGGGEVRCHELARAVRRCLLSEGLLDGWTCVVRDGSLCGIEHSWIEIVARSGDPRRSILDVYAPGRLPQVQLVDHHFAVAREYLVRLDRSDVDSSVVRRLEREMVRGLAGLV
jgi:hypothetical protein